MIHVVTTEAPAVDAAALVVRVAQRAAPIPDEATIGIVVADPVLAAALTRDIAAAVAAAVPALESPPVVAMRSRKTLALVAATVPGAIAIVTVTRRNARHLLELAESIRAAGALGIQLVWDGAERARIERHVFAVLERARATPHLPPIVLATTDRPVAALLALVASRMRKDER